MRCDQKVSRHIFFLSGNNIYLYLVLSPCVLIQESSDFATVGSICECFLFGVQASVASGCSGIMLI